MITEHPLFTVQLSNDCLKLSDFLVVPDNNKVFGGKTVMFLLILIELSAVAGVNAHNGPFHVKNAKI